MTEVKKSFEFTDVDKNMTGIKIVEEGKYKGLHWTFGTVTFAEEPDKNGNMSCKFDYVIHDNPSNLEEDQDMLNYMGDILVEVLDEELKIDDNFNNIDIPLAPEEIVKGIIDSHTATDYIRENAEEFKDILAKDNNDNDWKNHTRKLNAKWRVW